MEIKFSQKYTLTREHPASHYGAGVLLDTETGIVYGPSDVLPPNPLGSKMLGVEIKVEAGYFIVSNVCHPTVASLNHRYSGDQLGFIRRYLSQDPSGRFELPDNETLTQYWREAEERNDAENKL